MPPARPELIEPSRGTSLRVWLRAYRRTRLQLLAAGGVIGLMIMVASQIQLDDRVGTSGAQETETVAAPPTSQLPTPVPVLQGIGVSESVTAEGHYRAEVFNLVLGPEEVRFGFRAVGLPSPYGACLTGDGATQLQLQSWHVETTIYESGRYEGTFVFRTPIGVPGTFDFRYSCFWGDYSRVPLFSL